METIIDKNQGFLYTFSRHSFDRKNKASKQEPYSKKDIILILVADDHPYLIHGVEADLNKDLKIKIVGTANSYNSLLEKASELQPDLVLMDLRMPDQEKYDFKQYIETLKTYGKCKVIVFSNETGWARIHRCLDVGASAYIEKAISTGRLADFIHRIYENDELLIYTAEKLPEIQFSPRQKEILHLIADGKENDEISSVLNIEIKTVQSYLNEIKAKFAESFGIHPIRPRILLLLASKLGFGSKI